MQADIKMTRSRLHKAWLEEREAANDPLSGQSGWIWTYKSFYRYPVCRFYIPVAVKAQD